MTKSNPLPKHIAFIMDGNGRWAKARGLSRLEGHRQGSETIRGLVDKAEELGVQYLTFYAFSTENWRRSAEEIAGLMALAKHYFKTEAKALARRGVRVHILGDLSEQGQLPADMRTILQDVMHLTAGGTRLTVNFAINYGGRDDIIRAVRRCAASGADMATLREDHLTSALDTTGQPDPELMIRTGGDSRISNFLLWQLAYAELMFVRKSWPDFSGADLAALIEEYQGVSRRFGGRPDETTSK